jgi:hypothetical protein
MPLLSINEWMQKFASITEWVNDYPTLEALKVYPYFYVDLLASYETDGYKGMREVLQTLRRFNKTDNGWLVSKWWDIPFYQYPPNVKVIRIDDEGETRCGYTRRYEQGLFEFDGRFITEFLWHRHDGYGEEAGTVQVWAWYTPELE